MVLPPSAFAAPEAGVWRGAPGGPGAPLAVPLRRGAHLGAEGALADARRVRTSSGPGILWRVASFRITAVVAPFRSDGYVNDSWPESFTNAESESLHLHSMY